MIKTLLKRKKLIYFVVLAFAAFGVFSYQTIAKKEFPNTAIPVINTNIIAPGYTAEEIDNQIIPEIEADVKELNDVKNVYAYSYDNGAMVVVEFSLDVLDVSTYEDELDKAISADGIDENVSVSTSSDFKESHVIYTMSGSDATAASEAFKKDLEELDFVNSVELSNNFDQQLIYNVDKSKLEQAGINYSDFINLIGGIATELPLGYIEEGENSISFIATNNFTDQDSITNYQLAPGITLGDLGSVSVSDVNDDYYAFNGEQAIFINVYFNDGIDFTNVSDEIDEVKDNFSFDGDYELDTLVYQPESVDEQINSVFINLAEAVILVVIIVMIGLGIKNAILIGLSLPFTILGTIGVLNLIGQDLQQISIAGLIISIGIVVDNAIVINDAIVHKLDSGEDKQTSIMESIKENFVPVLTSTTTTIAAFTPILFLGGLSGVIAFSLPVTVIIALIISFVFSLVITPLLADSFLKPHLAKKKTKKVREYNFLKTAIKKPYISIIIVLVSLAVAGIAAIGLQISVFPTADKNVIYIEYSNKESTTLDDTIILNDEIMTYIQDLDYIEPQLENYASVIGGRMPQFYATLPTLPQLPNEGFIYLDIKDKSMVTEIKEQLNDDLEKEFNDQAIISAKEVELNTPTAPIIVTIDGESTEEINSYTQETVSEIRDIEGVKKADINIAKEVDNYELVIKDNILSDYQLTAAQIEQEIAMLLNDSPIDVVDSEEFNSNLIIRSDVNSKEQLLNTTFIFNSTSYKGSNLFEIKKTTAYDKYTDINYENAATIDVYLEDSYGVSSVQGEIEDYLSQHEQDNINYHFSGEADLTKEVFSGISIAALFAVIAIFVILLIQFNSFRNSFIILLTVPLSFVGSIIALRIGNYPISFAAGLGLTALMGIVVNNGILLLSYIKEYEKTSDDLLDVCYNAIKRRLRPIILSNATTAIGLIPLIISGGSLFEPMAVALAGGIIVGTILTIFVVPAVYYMLNKKRFMQDVNDRNKNK